MKLTVISLYYKLSSLKDHQTISEYQTIFNKILVNFFKDEDFNIIQIDNIQNIIDHTGNIVIWTKMGGVVLRL